MYIYTYVYTCISLSLSLYIYIYIYIYVYRGRGREREREGQTDRQIHAPAQARRAGGLPAAGGDGPLRGRSAPARPLQNKIALNI